MATTSGGSAGCRSKHATPAGKCLLTGIGTQRAGHGGLDQLGRVCKRLTFRA